MSEEEKKTRLDELPDAATEAIQRKPAPRMKKQVPEPRIEQLKPLSDRQKVAVMDQTWHFDDRDKNFGWLFYIAFLGFAELSPFYENYVRELNLLNLAFFNFGGDLIREFTVFVEGIIRHPFVLILLTPIFFRFSRESAYAFDITFDGIRTVRKVLPSDSKELVCKVFIKWKEIERVEKAFVGKKEILRLFSPDGAVADVIWYIDVDKKKAVKHLLNGMIGQNHPFRIFLANEKELS